MRYLKFHALTLCLIMVFTAMQRIEAMEVINIDDTAKAYPLKGSMDYWIADNPDESIDQQLETISQKPYQPFSGTRAPVRFKNIWFRLSFKNALPQPTLIFLSFGDFLYDELGIYFQKNGQWQKNEFGLMKPYASRRVDYRFYVYPFPLRGNETINVYFRVKSSFLVRITPQLISGNGFTNSALFDHGVALGIICFSLGILFYLLLISGVGINRETTPLIVFLIVSLLVMFFYSGFLQQVLDDFRTLHRQLLVIGNGLLMATGLWVIDGLFGFSKANRITYYSFWFFVFWITATTLLSIGLGPDKFISLTNLITIPAGLLLMISASIYGVVKKSVYAKPVFIGVLGYFVINSISLESILSEFSITWERHIFETSTVFLVTFLALGVAQRIVFERREIENLRHRAEISDAANQAKSQFLASMSHEIRTPMNGVLGMAQLLENSNLDSVQRSYAQTILSTGRTLLGVINDVLDFSKIEAGKLSLESVDINLDQLLSQTINLFWKTTTKNDVIIGLKINNDVPIHVSGDQVRIQQIINNLMSNALKFTDHGKIVLEASLIKQENNKAFIKFNVSDSGIGISPDDCKKLFQPYSQADVSTTRRYGGTGLGLVICQRLVDLMGGEIGVNSQPGKGSDFWFTIPLELNQEKNDALSRELKPIAGKKIGIIFSNQSFAANFCDLLSYLQAIPVLVDDIETARSADIDLLICSNISWQPKAELINIIRKKNVPMVRIIGARENDTIGYHKGVLNISADNGGMQTVIACIAALKGNFSSDFALNETLPDLSGLHILIAEDNPVNRQLLQAFLTQLKISFDIATNGIEAIHFYKENPGNYSAILMDCEMPEMDGFIATQEIRQFELANTINRTAIFALTAHAFGDISERCKAAGMDQTLIKPINLKELGQLLQTLKKSLTTDN